MIRLKSIFLITFLLISLASCKERAKRAKVYHDDIVKATAVVTDSVIDYADAVHSGDKLIALDVSENYLALILRTIGSINHKGNFEGDSSLRSSSANLMHFYKDFIQQNFVPFFNEISNDTLSESEVMLADSLHRKMMDDEAGYWENFNAAEKKFKNTYDLMCLE